MPASALARLRAKPPAERRIAIVLAGSADVPRAAVELLAAFRGAGYRVKDAPADGEGLTARLQAEPEESLSFATYSAVFATLPMPLQQRVSSQWGAAERDPLFRPGRLDCGRFVIPALRCGNIAVLVPPARADAAPPHSYLAAYAWLSDEFRADAVIDLGGLDAPPTEVLGPLPRLCPPIVDGEVRDDFIEAIDRDAG
ncbi:MAG TPA: cobaltochelatase subunit CobN [Stellaceae bacterium]|jgi:cobaltochelatase CobN